jgi:hypothetical protein
MKTLTWVFCLNNRSFSLQVEVRLTSSPLVRLIAPLPEDVWVYACLRHYNLCAFPRIHHWTIRSVVVAVTVTQPALKQQQVALQQYCQELASSGYVYLHFADWLQYMHSTADWCSHRRNPIMAHCTMKIAKSSYSITFSGSGYGTTIAWGAMAKADWDCWLDCWLKSNKPSNPTVSSDWLLMSSVMNPTSYCTIAYWSFTGLITAQVWWLSWFARWLQTELVYKPSGQSSMSLKFNLIIFYSHIPV